MAKKNRFNVHLSIEQLEARELLSANPLSVIASGDFDADGDLDAVMHMAGSEIRSVWLQENGQPVASYSLGNVDDDWEVIGVGDFDRDGDDDLVMHLPGTESRWIWNIQNGRDAGGIDLGNIDSRWKVVGVGDFDGDGDDDLAMHLPGTESRWIWQMENGRDVGGIGLGGIDSRWSVVGVGDFDGDGDDDLAMHLPGTESRWIWQMENGRDVGGIGLGGIDSRWSVVGVGDFDGDGDDDLLLHLPGSETRFVWTIQNSRDVGGSWLGQIDDDWKVVGVGDVDLDGDDDLLLEIAQTGQRFVWVMENGRDISGASPFPSKEYNYQFGYGLVDAQAAVTFAVGTNIPDVPNFGGANDWNLNMVNAPEVWAQGFTGQGIVVAVVDTGVDYNHWDLDNNIWRNPGEIQDGIDNDGNGFVDDVVGWDFVDNDWLPFDIQGHGTHVAGTIAGENNGFGVTGVAPNAQIMPVRVLGAGATSGDVADGIRYAADMGADVINMSLGNIASNYGTPWPNVKAAIDYATQRNVVVVMSAGNEGQSQPDYPARYAADRGIAIGAVSSTNEIASFSNRAGSQQLDYVVAPGVGVFSIDITSSSGFGSWDGTSMAAPHVAGVAALMLSANPNLTPDQVEYYITATANPSGITVSSTATTSSSSGTSAYAAGGYVSGQATANDSATEDSYVETTRNDQASRRHVAATLDHHRSSQSRNDHRWTSDINGSFRDTDNARISFDNHTETRQKFDSESVEVDDFDTARNQRSPHSAIQRRVTVRDSEVVDDFFAKFQRQTTIRHAINR